jgi:murein DD-endopeptidase MepM/ murein hydrolase activator NlpD
MGAKVVIFTLVSFLIGTTYAQQVEVPREGPAVGRAKPSTAQSTAEVRPQTVAFTETSPPKLSIEQMRKAGALAAERVKEEDHEIKIDASEPAPPVQPKKQISANTARPLGRQPHALEAIIPPPPNLSRETALVKLADGFDLPVGKPDGKGYYNARGFTPNGHLGDDWNGVGGGDTDLGDPIYSIGNGLVVFARDCHQGWGNVVIVRHAYREGLGVHTIDSLYGHLDKILVHRGQPVARGQQVGTMGTAHGLYDSHLHLEIRKNIAIGMSRDKFAKDRSNYYEPTDFIVSHRHLQSTGASYRVATNTFTYDARIPWDKLRNYTHAHSGGGSSESAYALKKALAAQSPH